MEFNFIMYHTAKHETSRKPSATGEASPLSCPVAPEGHDIISGCRKGGLFCKFRIPLATGLHAEKGRRFEAKTGSRASSQAFEVGKKATGRYSPKGSDDLRLSYGSLDDPAGGICDSKVFWVPVSSQSHLESTERVRLELSEAGTESSGK